MANNTYYHWLIEVEATTAVGDEAASPIRRWWSGQRDLTFDSKTWEGTASDDEHGSLVTVSSVQETSGIPDKRLRIQLNVTNDSVRALLARDIGTPKVTLQFIWSRDNRTWQRIPRQYRGNVSNVTLNNGLLDVEIETRSGDVDKGLVIYWNDESHRSRHPTDTGFRHLRNLQTEGALIKWPFNYD